MYFGPELPSDVYVVIDGMSDLMTYVSGTAQAGATYSMTTTLSKGSHSFAFNATGPSGSWSDPISPGVYSGLKVTGTGTTTGRSRFRRHLRYRSATRTTLVSHSSSSIELGR